MPTLAAIGTRLWQSTFLRDIINEIKSRSGESAGFVTALSDWSGFRPNRRGADDSGGAELEFGNAIGPEPPKPDRERPGDAPDESEPPQCFDGRGWPPDVISTMRTVLGSGSSEMVSAVWGSASAAAARIAVVANTSYGAIMDTDASDAARANAAETLKSAIGAMASRPSDWKRHAYYLDQVLDIGIFTDANGNTTGTIDQIAKWHKRAFSNQTLDYVSLLWAKADPESEADHQDEINYVAIELPKIVHSLGIEEVIALLRPLTALRSLDIGETRATGEGLAHLRPLTALRSLGVEELRITAPVEASDYLRALPELEVVYLEWDSQHHLQGPWRERLRGVKLVFRS